jgi:cation transport ATPase
MNDQQQDNSPKDQSDQPEYSDWRAERHQRRVERRAARASRYGGSWIGGAILILVGIVILLQNLTSFALQNWWALFILIPAIGAFGNAWRIYQSGRQITVQARASLIGGIILTMVVAIFLFNLNWTILGPVLLILAGLGLLINVILPG